MLPLIQIKRRRDHHRVAAAVLKHQLPSFLGDVRPRQRRPNGHVIGADPGQSQFPRLRVHFLGQHRADRPGQVRIRHECQSLGVVVQFILSDNEFERPQQARGCRQRNRPRLVVKVLFQDEFQVLDVLRKRIRRDPFHIRRQVVPTQDEIQVDLDLVAGILDQRLDPTGHVRGLDEFQVDIQIGQELVIAEILGVGDCLAKLFQNLFIAANRAVKILDELAGFLVERFQHIGVDAVQLQEVPEVGQNLDLLFVQRAQDIVVAALKVRDAGRQLQRRRDFRRLASVSQRRRRRCFQAFEVVLGQPRQVLRRVHIAALDHLKRGVEPIAVNRELLRRGCQREWRIGQVAQEFTQGIRRAIPQLRRRFRIRRHVAGNVDLRSDLATDLADDALHGDGEFGYFRQYLIQSPGQPDHLGVKFPSGVCRGVDCLDHRAVLIAAFRHDLTEVRECLTQPPDRGFGPLGIGVKCLPVNANRRRHGIQPAEHLDQLGRGVTAGQRDIPHAMPENVGRVVDGQYAFAHPHQRVICALTLTLEFGQAGNKPRHAVAKFGQFRIKLRRDFRLIARRRAGQPDRELLADKAVNRSRPGAKRLGHVLDAGTDGNGCVVQFFLDLGANVHVFDAIAAKKPAVPEVEFGPVEPFRRQGAANRAPVVFLA